MCLPPLKKLTFATLSLAGKTSKQFREKRIEEKRYRNYNETLISNMYELVNQNKPLTSVILSHMLFFHLLLHLEK